MEMQLSVAGSATTPRQTAVEVEIWSGYLLNKTNIARTLYGFSIDNGPFQDRGDDKVVLRFMVFDWDNNVRDMLLRNNIHSRIVANIEINPLEHLLKKKILVAEDDPDILNALSLILEDAGYHVRATPGGSAILEGNFYGADLFIIDWKMPDVDGLELCKYLRLQSTTKYTPVIMISAHPHIGRQAALAGADGYIEKPFHMHYLLNLVMKYTRQSA